jgi:hypothetical protein
VIVAARFLNMLADATESESLAKRATAALKNMELDAQNKQLFLYVAGAAGSLLPCTHHC